MTTALLDAELAWFWRTTSKEDGGLTQRHQRTTAIAWNGDGEWFERVATNRFNTEFEIGGDEHLDAIEAGHRFDEADTLAPREARDLAEFVRRNYDGPKSKPDGECSPRTLRRRHLHRMTAREPRLRLTLKGCVLPQGYATSPVLPATNRRAA